MILAKIALGLCLLLPTISFAAEPVEKPIVAINLDVSDRGNGVSYSLPGTYVDAVVAAGGIPIILPATESTESIPLLIEMADAFVFTGGADINPERYGEDRHETVKVLSTRRETFDFALMDAALASGKPVLGVCLGMQEMNVHRGGTLVQDIPSMVGDTVQHRRRQGEKQAPMHTVTITPDSKLHTLLGVDSYIVNSVHHQAVGKPGKNVNVTASTEDGVVESIELTDYPFAIGVQWHPEDLIERGDEVQVRIFKGLIEAAIENKNPEVVSR